jgi:hypothetical protein
MDPEVQNKIAAMAEALGVKAEALYGVLVAETGRLGLLFILGGLAAILIAGLVAYIAKRMLADHEGDPFSVVFPAALSVGLLVILGVVAIVEGGQRLCAPNSYAVRAILGK